MEYVNDFQGFHDDENNFIFKGLCIQGIENGKLVTARKQYLFLPPFDFRHLSKKKKKDANY